MKQNKRSRNIPRRTVSAPRYPNAADHNYYVRKTVDVVTAILSGMGLVSAMLFLVILA